MLQLVLQRFHLKGIDGQGGKLRRDASSHSQARSRLLHPVRARPLQTTCVQNCTDKFLKHSERVGARFAEHNAGELRCFRDRQAGDDLLLTFCSCRRANAGQVN